MNITLRNFFIAVSAFFAIGLVLGLYLAKNPRPVTPHREDSGAVVATTVTSTLHPVAMRSKPARLPGTCECPTILAMDSPTAEPGKEVLSEVNISDHAGTVSVSNVLDTTTGASDAVVARPSAEWLNKWSVSAGVSAGSLGYGIQQEATISVFRIKDVYVDLRVDAWEWTGGSRRDSGHSIDGQAALLIRYNF